MHPSKDYLLITSNKGKIFLFRIDTGENRGTIQIPQHALGCCIDPSGLYVIIQVPPFSQLTTGNSINKVDFGGNDSHERDIHRSTVLMYEIGTGNPASEILSVFDISEMRFSSNGRYVALASSSGSVSIWALGDHLYLTVS